LYATAAAGETAVGVLHQIGVLHRHLRPQQVIDQRVRLGNIQRVLADGQIVEEHLSPLFRDRIADLDAILGLGGTLLHLLDVASPPRSATAAASTAREAAAR
jgi:hypothetical protein